MVEDRSAHKPAVLPKDTTSLRIAVVKSTYHGELTDSMAAAAIETFVVAGVPREHIDTFEAPGAWEIPLLAQHAFATKRYDGIVTFGVIVKGETYHFDMIANEVGHALMQLSLKYEAPVALEVLAVMDIDQARVRALGAHNKGAEAATAVLATIAAVHG